jgi:hypothetical protein
MENQVAFAAVPTPPLAGDRSWARFGRALNRGGSQTGADATRVAGDEPAGRRRVSSHERRCPQTIALTLRTIRVFPMTHHVECVALLERTGSDLQRSDSA